MESKVRKFNIKAAGIAIKLLCFLLLAVLGCRGCVTMFYPMNDISCNWLAFYAQERNSVDTLIVGSSHAYSSFDPAAFRERSTSASTFSRRTTTNSQKYA